MDPFVLLGTLALTPFLLLGAIWAARNKKRIPDLYRLRFKRKRVVKVNFHNRAGRNEERFVVPDHEGMMRIDKAPYIFSQEFAITNERFRIPEVTVIENQIFPPDSKLAKAREVDHEIEVPQPDGTVLVVKQKVPTYILSYKHEAPKKLMGLWAHQIGEFADSGIIHDITVSTARVMKLLEWTFYLVIAILAVVLIGDVIIYNRMKELGELLNAVIIGGFKGAS